ETLVGRASGGADRPLRQRTDRRRPRLRRTGAAVPLVVAVDRTCGSMDPASGRPEAARAVDPGPALSRGLLAVRSGNRRRHKKGCLRTLIPWPPCAMLLSLFRNER